MFWSEYERDCCLQKSKREPTHRRVVGKRWSDASSTEQRPLHSVLVCFPTTASSAQFCLLCCQPEPVPRSLAARMSQLTPRDPCRLLAWSGQTINTGYSACSVPLHSITKSPKATGEQALPANNQSAPAPSCESNALRTLSRATLSN